jgi:hypothetical protein
MSFRKRGRFITLAEKSPYIKSYPLKGERKTYGHLTDINVEGTSIYSCSYA